ncbi:zinc ribbon domain-containing protein [Streptomyces sp. NPDC047002]|uniref:zinc ribbon domain-containing protein n=1 Tax=Streptomyces sp. NPDC047002 TaxID=3155475 RepID=UPI0034528AF9
MPRYDYRCADCGAVREVRAAVDEADSLELVCLGCGGPMAKVFTTAFTAVGLGRAPAPPPSAQSPKPAAGHTCSHGAVRLTAANPFAKALPSPGSPGER